MSPIITVSLKTRGNDVMLWFTSNPRRKVLKRGNVYQTGALGKHWISPGRGEERNRVNNGQRTYERTQKEVGKINSKGKKLIVVFNGWQQQVRASSLLPSSALPPSTNHRWPFRMSGCYFLLPCPWIIKPDFHKARPCVLGLHTKFFYHTILHLWVFHSGAVTPWGIKDARRAGSVSSLKAQRMCIFKLVLQILCSTPRQSAFLSKCSFSPSKCSRRAPPMQFLFNSITASVKHSIPLKPLGLFRAARGSGTQSLLVWDLNPEAQNIWLVFFKPFRVYALSTGTSEMECPQYSIHHRRIEHM